MKIVIPILIFSILSWSLWAQPNSELSADHLQQDSLRNGIGGELRGMNIAGVVSITTGATVGILADGFSDTGRSGIDYPVVAAGLVVAPSSLVGLGLGSLLGKKKSKFSRSFQMGVGLTFSPVLVRNPPKEEELMAEYVTGLNVRVLSAEIGKWRYNLGFNHFFERDYQLFGRTEHTSWQSINLDLHYLFYISENFKLYPMVGTQYYNFLKAELYTNFGAGFNFEFLSNWNFYAEIKVSLDPDENPSRTNYSFGALYYL